MIGEEVRARPNMIRQNKDKLDHSKISLVKKWAFEHMPFDKEKETSEELSWRKCHCAIDEACRRISLKERNELPGITIT